MLATIALAALAAALMVLGERTPAGGADAHCLPFPEAMQRGVVASSARGPAARPVAASWASTRCGKLALTDGSFDAPPGAP